MFDVGFSEVMLIGLVALVVLGPERLPGAARTVGAVIRRARASWESVKTEVEREIAADEIKRSVKEAAAAADPGVDLHATAEDIRRSIHDTASAIDPTTAFNAAADEAQRHIHETAAAAVPAADGASIAAPAAPIDATSAEVAVLKGPDEHAGKS